MFTVRSPAALFVVLSVTFGTPGNLIRYFPSADEYGSRGCASAAPASMMRAKPTTTVLMRSSSLCNLERGDELIGGSRCYDFFRAMHHDLVEPVARDDHAIAKIPVGRLNEQIATRIFVFPERDLL